MALHSGRPFCLLRPGVSPVEPRAQILGLELLRVVVALCALLPEPLVQGLRRQQQQGKETKERSEGIRTAAATAAAAAAVDSAAITTAALIPGSS